MPEHPESEGSRLITLKQIEQEHGVSRSALHTYRRSASFPQPVPVEGSTKTHYRADEVAAWFAAHPPQQGKRTDLADKQQGDPMAATTLDVASLYVAIRGQSGDHVLKRFEDIERAVLDEVPDFLSLPLAERSALIGELYAEVYRFEGAG